MQQWLAFPYVRYVLWLIAGVLLAFYLPGGREQASLLGSVAVVAFFICTVLSGRRALSLAWSSGFFAAVILLCLGYWRADLPSEATASAGAPVSYWLVEVAQAPVATQKGYRFQAEVRPVRAEVSEAPVRALVFLSEAPADASPQPGLRLLVKGNLQRVKAPLNPYEFDYQAYLAGLGVHYQLYASAAVAAPPAVDTAVPGLAQAAFLSRQYLLQVVEEFVPDKEAAAVVSAMVLGHRDALERELQEAYSTAGVMHVLAVSGLHVGLVYGVFYYLLFRFVKRRWWKRLLWLFGALLVLWCYAWLTGLAPSALRAATMFSMIAVGKAFLRRGNVYNSIAVSAFVLLLINPLLILQVGFQLSYLAVIGIVYLQPRISRWYQPEQRMKKKVWELLSVTLAAQLATFPLGLYYFHQFPTYFFIGNLLAVPLASFILYGTLGLFVLHGVPMLNVIAGWAVTALTQVLNSWVAFTELLPSSRLLAVISAAETLLLYVSIIGLLVFFRKRSIAWAGMCFTALFAIAISGFVRAGALKQQERFIIYQLPGHSLFYFVKGNQELLLPLGEVPEVQQLNYHIAPARLHYGFALAAESPAEQFAVPQQCYKNFRLLVWQGLRVGVVEGPLPDVQLSEPLALDVLLLRNSPKVELEQLGKLFRFDSLVVDASNSYWYRKKMGAAATALSVPIHITSEKGAFAYQQ